MAHKIFGQNFCYIGNDYCLHESTEKWQPVADELLERKICKHCGKVLEERPPAIYHYLDYIWCSDGMVKVDDGGKKIHRIYSAKDLQPRENGLVIDIAIRGWFACNGGAYKYVYSCDNGVSWNYCTGHPTDGYASDAHIEAIEKENLGISDYDNSIFRFTDLSASLNSYIGQIVNVMYGAIPENNKGVVIPFLTFTGIDLTRGLNEIADVNVTFGTDEPIHKNHLWVKTDKPAKMIVTPEDAQALYSLSQVSELNSGRTAGAACGAIVGTKIYLFKGKYVDIFDTLNKTYAMGSNPNQCDVGYAAAAVGFDERIWTVGGYSDNYLSEEHTERVANEKISTYYPNSNIINDKGGFTNPIGVAAVRIGDAIYTFGGARPSTATAASEDFLYTNAIRKITFDTYNTPVISTVGAIPTELSYIAAVRVGTKIYLLGGEYYDTKNDEFIYSKSIYVFDIETNGITTLAAELPMSKGRMAAATVGTKIFLFGGRYYGNGLLTSINVFDTETDTITTLGTILPIAVRNMVAVAADDKIYLFGGLVSASITEGGVNGVREATEIYEFWASELLESGTVKIKTVDTKNIFRLVDSDSMKIEIGVEGVYMGNADNVAEAVETRLYNGAEWAEIE